jgi:prophage regulatory protein
MSSQHFASQDVRQSLPPRLYRLCHLTAPDGRIGVSKATLYRLIKAGKFPPPIRITERLSGWDSTEVDAWINAKSRGVQQ